MEDDPERSTDGERGAGRGAKVGANGDVGSPPALTVGATVRTLREARGWSLQRLASRAHLSKQHLWDIERGAARPHELTIKHLARALGVRASDLMGDTALDEATRPLAPSLRAFAARRGLGAAQVEALAGLHYRGRAPQTVAEWELIWRLLRAVLDDENGAASPGVEATDSAASAGAADAMGHADNAGAAGTTDADRSGEAADAGDEGGG